jgi:hypothetical protein
LQQQLEGMAAGLAFGGLTWYWGPKLDARNKARFRPFVLKHFSDYGTTGADRWSNIEPIAWEGEPGQALDA